MRRILSATFLVFFCLSHSLGGYLYAAEPAAVTLKEFEISSPTEVKVNEAFDVTIRAIGSDDKKMGTYVGTVGYDTSASKSDIKSDLIAGEYTFTISDEGEKTFSKKFTFKKAGEYTLSFYDTDSLDSEAGEYLSSNEVTIKVSANGGAPVGTVDISIDEPSEDITVTSSDITVSGKTKPTSAVNIKLNGIKMTSELSDATGAFTSEVTGLKSGENILIAEVFDGSNVLVGTSSPVKVLLNDDKPALTSLKFKEGTEIFAGASVNLIAVGDPGLKLVQIKIGDKNIILDEDATKLGTYTGAVKLSDFEGESVADASIESQLGVKTDIPKMLTFSTISAKIEDIKVESTADKKVRFTFRVNPDLEQIDAFKIKYGTETKIYTKEVTTFQKAQIKEDTLYTWYVPGIAPGQYFATIIALGKDKKELPVNSGEQEFTISLDAAPTCYVDKISGLSLKKSETYSILSWTKLPDADSYQIFKKDNTGTFAMIDEIKSTSYRVNIDLGTEEEVFEDFKVRATCKNGTFTAEGAYSESVSVQTGPEMIILVMLVLASGISFILIRRGYI